MQRLQHVFELCFWVFFMMIFHEILNGILQNPRVFAYFAWKRKWFSYVLMFLERFWRVKIAANHCFYEVFFASHFTSSLFMTSSDFRDLHKNLCFSICKINENTRVLPSLSLSGVCCTAAELFMIFMILCDFRPLLGLPGPCAFAGKNEVWWWFSLKFE